MSQDANQSTPEQWTPQQWRTALDLLGCLLDGEPAEAVRARAESEGVSGPLAEMLRRHEQAVGTGFLDEPPTLVRALAGDDRPVFILGQLLASRFKVLRELGRGGMGEVYLAEDTVLKETVALKAVRRALGADPETRARFLAEVRSARQVTHPSVCRIYDLYDDVAGAFYSMQYLPGPTLAEVLNAGPMEAREAQGIAIEVAEALREAHRQGILHCDLKPGNVILAGVGRARRAVLTDFGLARAVQGATRLEGGTQAYMAPELLAGSPPDTRTDLFSYGRLLGELRPHSRIADWCAATARADRPASIDEVLAALRPSATRRNWLVGVVVGASVSAVAAYEVLARRVPIVGGRQRLVVSRFQPDDGEEPRMVRSLLLMALRQSPLLGVVPDDQVRGAVARAGLPLDELLKVARQGASTLVLDGRVRSGGAGFALELTLYESAGGRKLAEVHQEVENERQLARLAQNAAVALRSAVGESPESLGAPYAPLEQVTSRSPEALSLYFRAAYLYERGIRASDTESALDLLARATQIDSEFALAYHLEALVLTATDRVGASERAALRARAHPERLSRRERNWMDGLYRNIVGDFAGSADAYRRNIARYPEEAVFRRQFAFAAARLGRYEEALQENRAAMQLAPLNPHCASELVVNLAEAGRAEEALRTADGFVAGGLEETVFHRGRGLALMQLGRLEEARVLFGTMQPGAAVSPIVCFYQAGPLTLLGAFGEAERVLREGLAASGGADYADLQVRVSLGALYWLMGRQREASDCVRPMVELPQLGCNLRHVRAAGFVAARAGDARLAWAAADWLKEFGRSHDYSHARGGAAMAEAMAYEVDGDQRVGAKYEAARAQYPDPLTLLSAAGWARRHGQPMPALSALEELERLRGAVLKNYPAGLAVVARIEMAKVLLMLSRFEAALRIYEQVQQQWAGASETVPALVELRDEMRGRRK